MKHIGKCNGQRVTILFRTVPGEEHMCLIVFSDSLPSQIHDDVMRVLESENAQLSDSFSDTANKNTTTDGRNLLHALHQDGFIKKVSTASVTVTPNNQSTVRLDELNKMIQTIKDGGQKVTDLAATDRNRGIASTERLNEISESRRANKAARNNTMRSTLQEVEDAPLVAGTGGFLTDEAIAADLRNQATRAKNNAEVLLAEALRLEEEANVLMPLQEVKKTRVPKVKETQE